ncbi:MAG: ATP-dependent DNA ligase [Solirubrobacterales bacterium]
MKLPLKPPIKPQLAKSRKELPTGAGWGYEPKWDGFRAIAFVDGDETHVQSRNGKPLSRYFPELDLAPGRYVVDGELVILDSDGREEFDALQNRIHPAESRITMLAEETPARFRVFDVLAVDKVKLLTTPFSERRERLAQLIVDLGGSRRKRKGMVGPSVGSIELTPLTKQPAKAAPWLEHGEGVIAKELDAPYRPGDRKGMAKIKRVRTIDAVLVGWRPGKEKGTLGSLILGLYDKSGKLRVVGHTSGFRAKEKRELPEKLAPYETGERGTADPSRWAADRELEWISLRPELVVEVTFDHVSGGRIRHGAKVQRWREDRDPKSCLIGQLDA